MAALFLNSRLWRKTLRWALGVAVFVAVAIAAAIILLPYVVDVPRVRDALEHQLSQAVRGQVTWKDLDVRLVPAPHGVMRGARVVIPDRVDAAAEQLEIGVRLLPLLYGQIEIGEIKVIRPAVQLRVPPSTDDSASGDDPLTVYRRVLRPTMNVLQRFAPNTTLAIELGHVEVSVRDLPTIGASDVELRVDTDGKGIALGATAAGKYWDRVQIEGRIEFADLSARAKVDALGVKPQTVLDQLLAGLQPLVVLPSVSVRAEVRTDARTSLDVALRADLPRTSLRWGKQQLDVVEIRAEGTAKFSGRDIELMLNDLRLGELAPKGRASLLLARSQSKTQATLEIDAVDLGRVRDAVLAIAGDRPRVRDYAMRVRSGRISNLRLSAEADTVAQLVRLPHLRGSLTLAGGNLQLPVLEREITDIAARVDLADSTLKVSEATARLESSRITKAGAALALAKPLRLERANGQATLALDELLPWLRAKEPFVKLLERVPKIAGRADVTLHTLRGRFDQPEKFDYEVSVRPRHVQVEASALPAPATVDGGSVRVTTRALAANRVGVALLDSMASVSGEVAEYRSGRPRIDATVADGVARERLVHWLWQRTDLPQRTKPVTPLRFAAQHVQWSDAGLGVAASLQFEAGPAVGVDLALRGKELDVRRLTLKDQESDAVASFNVRANELNASFSGTLASRSVASMFAHVENERPGRLAGDLRLTIDREHPERVSASGKIAGENLNLANLLPAPIKLDRLDLEADGDVLRVRELALDWSGQKATIRGEIERQPGGPVIRAEVDSPGITLSAVLPQRDDREVALAQPAQEKTAETLKLWPLPVTGTVAMRTDYLQFKRLRVEPVRATLVLEPEQAELKVSDATVCGVAFPFSLRAAPDVVDAVMRISAKDQQLENVARCFSDERVLITGRFDLTGQLAVKGSARNIAAALTGPVEFHAHNGKIEKASTLAKILEVKAVGDILKGEVDLQAEGIGYHDIIVRGRFGGGQFTLEQGALDSPALGLAANGTIGLTDYQSRLTVLVAPFSGIDRFMRSIPIIGYVIGGVFTSIPVGVSGDIRDPVVVPLGPRAVTSELLGIFERTLKLPVKLVEPLGAEKPAD